MIPYKNRTIDVSKPIDLYRCLNRKGFIFSMRQFGKVVAHTDKIVLTDCKMIVNKAGKKKAIYTNNRNVHAFIKGYISDNDSIKNTFSFILKYNPFSSDNFHINEVGEVKNCKVIYLQNNCVYCQL